MLRILTKISLWSVPMLFIVGAYALFFGVFDIAVNGKGLNLPNPYIGAGFHLKIALGDFLEIFVLLGGLLFLLNLKFNQMYSNENSHRADNQEEAIESNRFTSYLPLLTATCAALFLALYPIMDRFPAWTVFYKFHLIPSTKAIGAAANLAALTILCSDRARFDLDHRLVVKMKSFTHMIITFMPIFIVTFGVMSSAVSVGYIVDLGMTANPQDVDKSQDIYRYLHAFNDLIFYVSLALVVYLAGRLFHISEAKMGWK